MKIYTLHKCIPVPDVYKYKINFYKSNKCPGDLYKSFLTFKYIKQIHISEKVSTVFECLTKQSVKFNQVFTLMVRFPPFLLLLTFKMPLQKKTKKI